MIRYAPPKGQLWGHRRGRVGAATLCRRVRDFLREHAAGEPVWSGRLSVNWEGAADGAVVPMVEALREATGLTLEVTERERSNGGIDKAVDCEFSGAELDRIAAWVDGLGDVWRSDGPCVMVSAHTVFDWKETGEGSTAGSMMGLQLSQPRGLTTLFNFRDVAHYQTMKRYLADHDVVMLQDKHVRPRGVLGVGT